MSIVIAAKWTTVSVVRYRFPLFSPPAIPPFPFPELPFDRIHSPWIRDFRECLTIWSSKNHETRKKRRVAGNLWKTWFNRIVRNFYYRLWSIDDIGLLGRGRRSRSYLLPTGAGRPSQKWPVFPAHPVQTRENLGEFSGAFPPNAVKRRWRTRRCIRLKKEEILVAAFSSLIVLVF